MEISILTRVFHSHKESVISAGSLIAEMGMDILTYFYQNDCVEVLERTWSKIKYEDDLS